MILAASVAEVPPDVDLVVLSETGFSRRRQTSFPVRAGLLPATNPAQRPRRPYQNDAGSGSTAPGEYGTAGVCPGNTVFG